MTALDITPFENSVARLEEGLARFRLDETDSQLRDGLIQRFEFTYELGFRTLKRYLAQAAAAPDDIAGMAFQDVIRTANQQGLLLGDWPAWRGYRDMRAKTSHSYAEATALDVVRDIPTFLPEVRFLRDELKRRLG